MDDLPYRLPMLLDGALGSCLTAAGMPSGVCIEKWILENPDVLKKIQNDFITAGSMAVCAPTFSANAACLSAFGLENQVEKLNLELVELTKSVAAVHGVPVGGRLCPSGLFVPPLGQTDFDDIYDIYREQVRALDKAGIDFFLIEEQTSLADMRSAVLAARTTNLPVFVTLEVDNSGHTLTGGHLLPIFITLQAMGVEAIGLSGSLNTEVMLPIIEKILPHTAIPVIVKPDAWATVKEDSGQKILLSPSEFAEKVRSLMQAGARIIGGGSGTTPEHIAALAEIIKEFESPVYSKQPDYNATAIESEVFFLGDDIEFSQPLVCNSELGDNLIDLDDERVNVALVNVDSIDDARLLAENSSMSRLPIAVHSDSKPVLDAALRYFQGRLLVDSDCLLDKESITPLCNKYGAILY